MGGLLGGMFSLFGSAQCLAGFHDWKEWLYASPTQCTQTRSCRRGCGKTASRVAHVWPPFEYIADDSCEQLRKCSRCGEEETKTADHIYSPLEYVRDGDCTRTCECIRCDSQLSDVVHMWGPWRFASPTSCVRIRSCLRCPEFERHYEVEHQWGVWEYEAPRSCDQVRFCRRCPEGRETKRASNRDHQWGEPERLNCYTLVRQCARCSETDNARLSSSEAEHVYGPWEREYDLAIPKRKCRECNHVEVNRDAYR